MDALNIAREYESVQYIVIKIGEEQYGIDISFIGCRASREFLMYSLILLELSTSEVRLFR